MKLLEHGQRKRHYCSLLLFRCGFQLHHERFQVRGDKAFVPSPLRAEIKVLRPLFVRNLLVGHLYLVGVSILDVANVSIAREPKLTPHICQVFGEGLVDLLHFRLGSVVRLVETLDRLRHLVPLADRLPMDQRLELSQSLINVREDTASLTVVRHDLGKVFGLEVFSDVREDGDRLFSKLQLLNQGVEVLEARQRNVRAVETGFRVNSVLVDRREVSLEVGQLFDRTQKRANSLRHLHQVLDCKLASLYRRDARQRTADPPSQKSPPESRACVVNHVKERALFCGVETPTDLK